MLAMTLTPACAIFFGTPGIGVSEVTPALELPGEPSVPEVREATRELKPQGYTTGSPVADLNGDGVVDFQDWHDFMNCFAVYAPCADLNGDGLCDLSTGRHP